MHISIKILSGIDAIYRFCGWSKILSCRHIIIELNSRYRLLILDGHESHYSVHFEKLLWENKIITMNLSADSSHLAQPIDAGCFGPLKKGYDREI
ncbi:Uncharacterized protein HZ326_18936 [Fusarium oxysporum f. sp. albedinis]|nr:Uncharacterized protein HZ326_18936 [Fusarium oxysporum f. sp. albedinis]